MVRRVPAPFTPVMETLRGLLFGTPIGNSGVLAAWCAGIGAGRLHLRQAAVQPRPRLRLARRLHALHTPTGQRAGAAGQYLCLRHTACRRRDGRDRARRARSGPARCRSGLGDRRRSRSSCAGDEAREVEYVRSGELRPSTAGWLSSQLTGPPRRSAISLGRARRSPSCLMATASAFRDASGHPVAVHPPRRRLGAPGSIGEARRGCSQATSAGISWAATRSRE